MMHTSNVVVRINEAFDNTGGNPKLDIGHTTEQIAENPWRLTLR